ncbi:hypothetical protein H4S08_003250 [Coemansia sp. RSA 1365]|nr:hypothetical protein H4S08_003250 [Coemansia sp. RSA 1365]
MPQFSIYTVDAFTSKPFQGNQAAIVPVPSGHSISDHTMQTLAAEMNIAETSFITPVQCEGAEEFQKASRFALRWFTPTVEAKLCGHATLAAAHVLFYELKNQNNTLHFDTLSGVLTVSINPKGKLTMKLPMDKPEPVVHNDNFEKIVTGVLGRYSTSTEILLSPVLRYLVIHEVSFTEEELVALVPNITNQVIEAGKRERVDLVMVTTKGNDRDFKSRVFAPWCGIEEDPVTGSAHTVLAPFWKEKLDKSYFVAQQCSKRSGELEVEIIDATHVAISGNAVVVIRGNLFLE